MLAVGPALELPWSCGESYAYTQGPDGDESHSGFARHAWDFAMPLGTDVVAVRSGMVSMIEMSSRFGGCSEVYAHDANYVLIDHHDGTAGLYLHVEGGSSDLQVGDRVEAGDVIARVGQTGWSCGPHLHFQVQEICGSWWCQSLPASFHRVEARGVPITKPGCGTSTWLLGLYELGLSWRHSR
jgi:murein DD-endopeptidase MepM/ murein hydrolase activator NlpD